MKRAEALVVTWFLGSLGLQQSEIFHGGEGMDIIEAKRGSAWSKRKSSPATKNVENTKSSTQTAGD